MDEIQYVIKHSTETALLKEQNDVHLESEFRIKSSPILDLTYLIDYKE